MWLPSRLPWAVLALPLLLTSPVASTQEETGTPAEEQAKRAEALEDELLEWAPDADAPRDAEPPPDPAPRVPGAEPEAPAEPQASQPGVGPDDWSIEWRNGLRLRRNDKRYDLHMGGLIQLETGVFHLDDDLRLRDAGWDADADVRRARLFAQGVVLDRILFKVDYDLGETEVRDLFVGLRGIPWLGTVKAGYIKEPFSLEQATSSRFNTFLERSLANTLVPRRNTGFLATSTLLEGLLRWEAGAFFVVDSFRESDGSETGFDQDWDLALRVTGVPLYRDFGSQLLLVGLSYRHRFADQESVRFSANPESRLVDALIATPDLDPVHSVDTLGVELAWVEGPLSMQAEFIGTKVRLGEGRSDYRAWGGYIQASRFLTGEQRHFGRASGKWGRVVPKREFDWGQRHLGALEVAARLSHLDLNDGNIRGGRQTNATLGLNWYVLSNVRFGVNAIWGHVAGDGDVWIGQTRLQIDF